MDISELKSKIRNMDEVNGFYLLFEDKHQIQPLINSGGCRTYRKTPNDKWIYVWRNRRKGAKQRVKEFISVLIIKEKNEKRKPKLQ